MIRETLGSLLQLEGYDVSEASNGREALEFLKHQPSLPCMILLDLMMPVMDGIEFRRTQLMDPTLADVPVIVITGKVDLGDLPDLKPLSIISKPFQISEVVRVVETLCPH